MKGTKFHHAHFNITYCYRTDLDNELYYHDRIWFTDKQLMDANNFMVGQGTFCCPTVNWNCALVDHK